MQHPNEAFGKQQQLRNQGLRGGLTSKNYALKQIMRTTNPDSKVESDQDVNTIPPNTEKWLRKRLRENNGYGIKL